MHPQIMLLEQFLKSPRSALKKRCNIDEVIIIPTPVWMKLQEHVHVTGYSSLDQLITNHAHRSRDVYYYLAYLLLTIRTSPLISSSIDH